VKNVLLQQKAISCHAFIRCASNASVRLKKVCLTLNRLINLHEVTYLVIFIQMHSIVCYVKRKMKQLRSRIIFWCWTAMEIQGFLQSPSYGICNYFKKILGAIAVRMIWQILNALTVTRCFATRVLKLTKGGSLRKIIIWTKWAFWIFVVSFVKPLPNWPFFDRFSSTQTCVPRIHMKHLPGFAQPAPFEHVLFASSPYMSDTPIVNLTLVIFSAYTFYLSTM